jgi:hypothetical protein
MGVVFLPIITYSFTNGTDNPLPPNPDLRLKNFRTTKFYDSFHGYMLTIVFTWLKRNAFLMRKDVNVDCVMPQ